MSDRRIRYGMIALDAAPTIVRLRGAPIIFHSPEETVEYAQLHDVQRWMVYGDPEGWWPLYTQDGPVNPPPEAQGPRRHQPAPLNWSAPCAPKGMLDGSLLRRETPTRRWRGPGLALLHVSGASARSTVTATDNGMPFGHRDPELPLRT